MKNNIFKIIGLSILLVGATGCSEFDEMNVDPNAVETEKVLPEYFLNNSIIGAQMNPEVAERAFVLYWKTAGRQQYSTGIAGGSYDDGWSSNYWGYVSTWLRNANNAINMADERQEKGTAQVHNENIKQVARIWRVYLMSELSDNFGSIPLDGFKGYNPEFNSTKDAYYFFLAELKDAVGKIDTSVARSEELKKEDPAYGYDWDKWIRYANSMRMRLAMRLSEVDAAKAKSEFEAAAATNKFISTSSENFSVQEKDGWDDLTGVMSRGWNSQIISSTLNNLYVGLGGVNSADQVSAEMKPYVKAEDYIGLYFPDQLPLLTNDPSTGYWLDGIPNKMDPRAFANFFVVGDTNNANYPAMYKYTDAEYVRNFVYADGSIEKVNVKNSWNAYTIGSWGAKLSRNGARGVAGYTPSVVQKYRNSTQKRVFFGSWESYLLIAEASLRGWATPMSDEAAYNKGVKESIDYNGVGQYYGSYIASNTFNRNGTSAAYSHTTEPGASHTMNFVDGRTKVAGTAQIKYPVNTIYKNGSVKNDKLTKIITQKFIANTPWLPLEGWNDHRRLGLPFFENPAVEQPLPNIPNLNSSNYMTNSVKNFPQRLPYPSTFRNSDPVGYAQAVSLLNGEDAVLTPLWWAKKN